MAGRPTTRAGAAAPTPPSRQLCRFTVGGHAYALDILRIKEIVNPRPIRAVPGAPSFVEGLIELRGAFLPVVDLRRRFASGAATPPPIDSSATVPDRKYIISRVDGRQVGLIVDAVAEVRRIADAAVAPPPPLALASGARPFFSGVVHWDDDIVLVVDLDQVLDEAERRDLAALGHDGAGK